MQNACWHQVDDTTKADNEVVTHSHRLTETESESQGDRQESETARKKQLTTNGKKEKKDNVYSTGNVLFGKICERKTPEHPAEEHLVKKQKHEEKRERGSNSL